ncbi:MAG: acyl--CoA ligase, partial [Proteobacteria bacterium]|nr:acyl--CoA ligase [Burkholderiales bacterium]
DALCDAVARALLRSAAQIGLARGDRVAILAANSAQFLAVACGAMRAGFVCVPINFKFPQDTIDYIAADSGAKLVFCDSARRAHVPAGIPLVEFEAGGPDGFDAFVDIGGTGTPRDAGAFIPVEPTVVDGVREPAIFLYTSGSTGRPKGVVLSHASHLWVTAQRTAGQDFSTHRMLVAAPLYHMNGLAMAQLSMRAGATLVLLPQFNARDYIAAIENWRCTWLTAVPPMLAMMLQEQTAMAAADLSSVRFIRMGSAPVSESLLARIHAAIPHATVANGYGTTEAAMVVFGAHPDGLPQPGMSVGYPHPAIALRLVDGTDRSALEGVLEMKSPALMNGYHNQPEATRKVLTDDGFYITGDIFRRDADGFHYFVGRADDMFVSGGENIYPGQVEKLLERHPAVEQACCVPVPDEIKGMKPVAFVIARAGVAVDEDALKRYALEHAPAYMHPRRVWFVDAFPLAGTNKIDRKIVSAQALELLRAP